MLVSISVKDKGIKTVEKKNCKNNLTDNNEIDSTK